MRNSEKGHVSPFSIAKKKWSHPRARRVVFVTDISETNVRQNSLQKEEKEEDATRVKSVRSKWDETLSKNKANSPTFIN